MAWRSLLKIVYYNILFACNAQDYPEKITIQNCFDVLGVYSEWNKSIPSRVYQTSYCAVRCSEGKRIALRSFDKWSQSLNCLECSCKRPHCEYYGICCPDYKEDYVPLPEFISNTTYIGEIYGRGGNATKVDLSSSETLDPLPKNYSTDSVYLPKLGCEKRASLLYISSCVKDFTGSQDIVRLCEQSIKNEEITVDYIALAVDTVTSVVYRNIYCALCNRAIMPQKLDVGTNCVSFMPFYQITDPNEMLRQTLSTPNGCCFVEKTIPIETTVFSCDEIFFRNTPVSSCDSAPSEWHYDEDIAKACNELNHTTDMVVTLNSKIIYKNIFCAICNMNSFPQQVEVKYSCKHNFDQNYRLPFSLLINFGKSSTVMSTKQKQTSLFQYKTCSNREWSSPDNICVPLVCTPGKLLNNRSCSTPLKYINGLHYSLNFLLFRHVNASNSSALTQNIRHDILKESRSLITPIFQSIENYSDSLSLEMGFIVDNITHITNSSSSETYTKLFWIESNLNALMNVNRDDYEKTLVERVINKLGHFQLNGEGNVIFKSIVLTRFTAIIDYLKNMSHWKTQRSWRNGCSNSRKMDENRCRFKFIKPIIVSRLLFCGYIPFRPSHYNISIDYTTLPPEITVTVDLNVTQVTISTISELNMIEVDGDGNLNVCHEVLDTKLNEIEEVYRKSKLEYGLSDVNLAQYIVTMTSLGCSMICLILTKFIYIWLPILQSTAGKNNIFLCLSLLLAQASLILIAHSPTIDIICITAGIMTHFLWLWMFSWTFICSFHMFNVFTASTRGQPATKKEEQKKLMKRIICSFIGPMVVVVSVIVVSVISSDGEHIGYGRDTCFLNSAFLVGISVVFPLALIIFCNVAFFARTVVSIYKIRRLQTGQTAQTDKQQDLFVYVKLSSVTGVFWTMAIIAEVSDLTALRIFSNVLNGFQGVFIFLSYICNKRVLTILSMKLSRSEVSGKTSTTGPQ